MPPVAVADPPRPKRAIVVKGSITLGNTALGCARTIDTVALARGFGATINGLVVDGRPKIDSWGGAGRKARVLEKGSQLTLGDWFNYGEENYGELAFQEIDPENGWSLKTLQNYGWVAKRINIEDRRMDRLTIRHHQLVAPLTPAKQRQWLTAAAADEAETPWTVARLKKALAEGEDIPVQAWYVIVGPLASGQVQSDLMDRLQAEGLGVKAVEKRRKKTDEPASGLVQES